MERRIPLRVHEVHGERARDVEARSRRIVFVLWLCVLLGHTL